MILKNVNKNNGECYRNEMYEEVEKCFQEREDEICKEVQLNWDKEFNVMKDILIEEFLKEVEKYKIKIVEEF